MTSGITWLLILLAILIGGFLLWLLFGRVPRRRRVYQRIQRLLHEKNWTAAHAAVAELRRLGPLSPAWEGRASNAEGECRRLAGEAALAEKNFEIALDHLLAAAPLLGLSKNDMRDRVLGAMLAEVRRRFAASTGPQTADVRAVIERFFQLHSPCAEASFWLGLCWIREDKIDEALTALRTAQETADKPSLDPFLYQGVLLLRLGKVPEALRCLAEANRLEPGCPFVAWQLGMALVAGNGDASLAVRALRRALGPRGLPAWIKTPEKAWVEGFPDSAHSYVPRLAKDQPFKCPVLGNDVAAMVRQAQFALSQAQYRLGNFQESANLCESLLKDAPPQLPVLRCLGLSLARLERYDEAYKHLRAAFEMEEPKSPCTAAYLALCGARGKPNQPEDKPKNVAWAIRLLSKFHDQQAHGGPAVSLPEWAAVCSAILAEARGVGLPVAVADLLPCCDALAAVAATDTDAAAAYHQLAATKLDAVRPRHAWLYCQAACQHGLRGERELDLLALTFTDRPAAQAFFAEHSWDFFEIEYLYLKLWAQQHPACFPEVLGPDYAGQAEKLLLQRIEQQEQTGQMDAALESAALLHRLLPHSPLAHDCLARLHYRRGELDQAIQILAGWQALAPDDYRPRLRLAVLLQQRGDQAGWTAALDGALALTQGHTRAEIAFLGARLALAMGGWGEPLDPTQVPAVSDDWVGFEGSPHPTKTVQAPVLRYLHECLQEEPGHADALACLAAVRWLTGDRTGLAAQAAAMQQPEVPNGRFQYMAAICHLAAADYPRMREAAKRATADAGLAVEARYLLGLAQLRLGDAAAAQQSLQEVALTKACISGGHARGLLGLQAFQEGVYNDAVYWWQTLDAGQRSAWKLEETYRGSVYLAALQAFNVGRFEQAAEQLRQAGQLGWRDRHLGPLLGLALFKEGQRRFYGVANATAPPTDGDSSAEIDPDSDHALPGPLPAAAWSPAVSFLEQAAKVGLKDTQGSYLLALAYKRQRRTEEARACLRRISPADADVWLQLGILSLQERQLAQAEQEFAQAWQCDPHSFAVGFNLLLTRLSLGKASEALPLAVPVVSLAPNPEEWYRATLLHALLRSLGANDTPDPVLVHMTAEDEQRLIQLLRGLGHLDTTRQMLQILTTARPSSVASREAHFETILLGAKQLLDHCDWSTAERYLMPWAHQASTGPATQLLLYNLLGCTTCLCQDFSRSIHYFQAALRLSGSDACLHQNLALAHEWLNELDKAELHWNRYFDLMERRAAWPGARDPCLRVVYEGHARLAGLYTDKERWPLAVYHLEAAQRLRPDHVETLERLFHLYHQVRRPDQARRVLQQLQQLRPGEPQFELYELDLIEINELEDLERWLNDITRIVQRHPGDGRVEDRANVMIGSAVTFLARTSDQLTEHLNKVMKQVRSLDRYQINWSAVHDVMRDLKRDFQQLRKLVSRCHQLTTHMGHRQQLRDLADHLDRKIDYCRKWQGS